MQAVLALEDGRLFRGKAFGSVVERVGEVVFNTSLTGYQEIFTDPSYAGQIVVLTNPQIGNYGTSPSDAESARPYIEGLVVREFSPISSNWRSTEVTDEYLERNGVPVISEIDTRAVVRHLRANGVMRGVISTAVEDTDALVAKARAHKKMDGTDLASVVSTKSTYTWDANEKKNGTDDALLPAASANAELMHVVAYDFGIKENILRMLTRENCRVTVVPAKTSAEDVLALKPDGVFCSNGPGDPEPLAYAIENVQALQGKVPLFGICLGHQIFGLALGGTTRSRILKQARWKSPRRTTTSTSILKACRMMWP
jgi:carbamoyl-phosphate synthase small subunit